MSRLGGLITDTIHPKTRMGTVCLSVSDLAQSVTFYKHIVGLNVNQYQGSTACLGAGGTDTLLQLTELTESPSQHMQHNHNGLYHFALLVPTRRQLAHVVNRLIKNHADIQGYSDHLVSEAVYFNDPDGNGIEICWDRPREQWRDENGSIRMSTYPLALDTLMAEACSGHVSSKAIHHNTTIGHIHIHVDDLDTAEDFYCDVLGFELVLRGGTSAAFVSAGGYHHHIGLNTWGGAGVMTTPQGSAGLQWYTVYLPHHRALSDVTHRIKASGNHLSERKEGLLALDPSGNGVMLSIPSP